MSGRDWGRRILLQITAGYEECLQKRRRKAKMIFFSREDEGFLDEDKEDLDGEIDED
jgi:hypothetical protein